MVTIGDARFDFTYRDEDLARPLAGRFSARAEDGAALAFAIEPLAAAEIDINRRTLVRARAEGAGPDARPLLGWVEANRFVPRAASHPGAGS
jgi:hypothetical protein